MCQIAGNSSAFYRADSLHPGEEYFKKCKLIRITSINSLVDLHYECVAILWHKTVFGLIKVFFFLCTGMCSSICTYKWN